MSVPHPAERLVVGEHRMWEVYAERHQSVREQDVPQHDEHDTEQAMNATPVGDIDRLDDGSIEEDSRNRSDTESTESDPAGRWGAAREGEQVRGIQHRAGEKRVNGTETDDTRAVHVAVNSRREPRRYALYAGYANIAAASSDNVPNPCRHDEPAHHEAYSTSQDIGDRRQLVGGDEHDAPERTEGGPENRVRRRPADIKQEVLSNFVGREIPGPSIVDRRGSAVRLRRHLFRVHRNERTAHPDTVCAAEDADENEQRDVDPEQRLDHT